MRASGIPETKCPACGKAIECASHPAARVPIPGDVSICFQCGNIMLFAADMTLRKPTARERGALASDERIIRVLAGILRKQRP